ncbi:helix-turn-helix domain-containing protein [Klebsiella michiganensis]|nr:helix-turn-helix domain-containing protein [Klebsiella michiganensis]MDM4527389.1 helix-turn-helix domain-containing protein [Klebsiella michiganensis]MDM4537970.1 helix-turn-helix domain-containing protein [Klebsiella michiganensis]MDS7802360.1 helix-turn-helix domain-containing protein [Klebsiella michiganensis]
MTGIVSIIIILIGLPAGSFLVCLNLNHAVLFLSLPMCINAHLRSFYGNLVAFLHDVWENVASLLSYHTAYLFYRDALVVQQRTYAVIRNHLQEMGQLPEETRMRVSILDYIQERTYLSRSSVLNVLSALKSGNYIAFKRGGYFDGGE